MDRGPLFQKPRVGPHQWHFEFLTAVCIVHQCPDLHSGFDAGVLGRPVQVAFSNNRDIAPDNEAHYTTDTDASLTGGGNESGIVSFPLQRFAQETPEEKMIHESDP